jgi:hypothetical protein
MAVPWPLKIVLDNVVGNHPAPLSVSRFPPFLGGTGKAQIAAVTGAAIYAESYAGLQRLQFGNH